ncbi:unnamed protein product [Hymenolepis diminuta]|uniref:REJ domain-containing protein n=1 Tax=Hymenolepis diminuta TaxID=6216 RepID=A0A0R3SP55_HYMDI|nr:unnamed protein product [Hymenolepis diminuta]
MRSSSTETISWPSGGKSTGCSNFSSTHFLAICDHAFLTSSALFCSSSSPPPSPHIPHTSSQETEIPSNSGSTSCLCLCLLYSLSLLLSSALLSLSSSSPLFSSSSSPPSPHIPHTSSQETEILSNSGSTRCLCLSLLFSLFLLHILLPALLPPQTTLF